MSIEIKPGVLVEIVSCRNPVMRIHVGHRCVVLRACSVYSGSWDVSGAEYGSEGSPCSWSTESLRPIPPDEGCGQSFAEVIKGIEEGVTA